MKRNPSSFKQEFLKKWAMGLQFCNNSKKEMSIFERKNTIKLSADVAMASAKNGSTYWSRALIANIASRNCDNKFLVDKILGNNSEKIKKASIALFSSVKMVNRSKKILKRARRVHRVKKVVPKRCTRSSIIAKRLIKKRTQVLKSLVPGGEFIDEITFLEETLDYIISLKAQIDVMKSVANASEHFNGE